jgi:saccharopine dehydrogenase-like NADP-dependent oxidoreductase
MKKVALFGVGQQGKTILYDLVRSNVVSEVIAADVDIEGLKAFANKLSAEKIRCEKLDAADEAATSKLLSGVDTAIEVLPPRFCLQMARLAVQNGVHMVNTMYMLDVGETDPNKKKANEKALHALDEKAKDMGVTVLPEMGMDPGIDLILCGQAVRDLDEVHELYSYGAGIPEFEAADNPLKYKVTWTFDGVLKSYMRPGRVLKEGHIIEVAANEMFTKEHASELDLEGFGRLEVYPNGDALKYAEILGIRDQVKTMGRFVLRWPGHCAFWEKMAKLGFLNASPIKVGQTPVIPRDFVCALLEPQLQYRDNERDLAIIRIDARGVKDGRRRRVIFQVMDKRDLETGFTAMARTVGFAASIGAHMILRGDIQKRGVLSPARDVPYERFLEELKKRGIHVERSVTSW